MEERFERYHSDLDTYHRRAKNGPCFVCAIVAGDPAFPDHPVVYEDEKTIAFLTTNPTRYGYTLVCPKEHREQATGDFSMEEYLDLQRVVHKVSEAVRQAVGAERMYVLTLGSNQGNAHVHWHVAPLPPGVPYEEQQFGALMLESAGALKIPKGEKATLAERIRRRIDRTHSGEGPLVGIDVGGTKLLLIAILEGDSETRRVPTGPGTGPELIEREVRSFLAHLEAPPAALGIAIPGLVDEHGIVTGCDTFPRLEGWRAANVFDDLGCPVVALNDADAALVEETRDLDPDSTAALVLAGTWIGTAVRANGGRLRGSRGWAGEFGYAPTASLEGRVARLDEVAGGGGVARRLDTDGAGAYERAVRGDPGALKAAREAGEALGLRLATLVNLLNPDLLVLGGGALELPGYREAALLTAERWSLPDSWRACSVRPVRAGEEIVALGAAREALR